MTDMKVPIVIPAFQPNETLLELVKELKNIGMTDIVIVDDGNTGGGIKFSMRQSVYTAVIL